MANYYGTTTSRGGKLKEGSEEAVKKIIDEFTFGNDGDLNVAINDGELQIWGEDSAYAYYKHDEDYDEEVMDNFLTMITPYLVEPLIVSEVGSEKCRYVQAWAYIARPNEKLVSVSLDDAIDRVLTNK